MHSLLLFIPMYNCERQIPRVLARITPDIEHWFAHVLVVDNGSTDGSHAAATTALQRLTTLPGTLVQNTDNYNLGGSHKAAFAWAIEKGFTHVVVLHGDDQANIADLVPLLRAGEHEKFDQLLGSRFARGARLRGYSLVRTWGNRVYNLLFSACSGAWLTDLGSGLNLYSTEYLRDGFYINYPNALTFNYYMVLAGVMRKARTRFFPISWREEDQRSNVKLFQQARRTLRVPLAYLWDKRAWQAKDYANKPDQCYTSRVIFTTQTGEPNRATDLVL